MSIAVECESMVNIQESQEPTARQEDHKRNPT